MGCCRLTNHFFRDINMNITRVEGYRRFCNKLWNATKFALMKLGPDYTPPTSPAFTPEFLGSCGLPELWILQKLSVAAEAANRNYASFNLMNVTGAVHQFWLYEVCDVFIEAVKPVLPGSRCAADVLYFVLEQGLQLLHPMMPFLTEELWQRLPRRPSTEAVKSICVAEYPRFTATEEISTAADKFDQLVEVVRLIRSITTERKLPPKSTKLIVGGVEEGFGALLKENEAVLQALAKTVGALSIAEDGEGEAVELPEGSKFTLKIA